MVCILNLYHVALYLRKSEPASAHPNTSGPFWRKQQVYGDDSLSRARVFVWHKRFSDGRDSVEDNERPGRPVTVSTSQKIARISEMVRKDRRLSVRMIAKRLNIDKETVRRLLHDDLNMSKVCAKLMPKNLSADQKLTRLQICSDVLEQFDKNPSME